MNRLDIQENKDLSRQELIDKFRESYLVSAHMGVYGGGFEKVLSQLINLADSENMEKIKMAWSNEWQRHLDMHIELIQRDNRVL